MPMARQAAVLVGTVFLALVSGAGSDAVSNAPPVSPEVSAAFSRTREICRDVERIRKRPFKRDVALRVQKPDDFRRYLKKSMAEQLGQQNIREYMLALKKVGLLEKEVELESLLVDLMENQAMAHYDPETGTYYLLKTNMPAQMLDLTSSHELCHAMQDQYHDLKQFLYSDMAAGRDNGDMTGARGCVTEGEATLVMMQWQVMRQTGSQDPESVETMVSAGLKMQATMDIDTLLALAMKQTGSMDLGGGDLQDSVREMRDVPRFIMESLLVSYMQGALMVDRVRKEKGWVGVEDLFRHPPESSEQVLHPEKLLEVKRDSPVDIRLAGLTNGLPAGWSLAEEDVAGELGVRVYLEIWQDPEARNFAGASAAAAGWGGDRYYFCRGSQTNQDLLVWKTVWDSGEDAMEFEMAYRLSLHQRFPGLKKSSRGRLGPDGMYQVWEVEPGRFLKIVSNGKAVGIVDSTERRMLDGVWKAGFLSD